MLAWFHAMTDIEIGLVIGSTTVLLCVALPFFVRRRYGLHVSSDVAKGAEEAFKLMSSMTMALMAFCLVQVQTLHRNVEDLAARESTIILKVDRALRDFGGPSAPGLRQTVRRYATSVAADEWPLMAKAGRSAATTALLAELTRQTEDMKADTPEQQMALVEMRGGMTQLNDVREARLSAARIELPPYFWMTIVAVVSILVVLGWFQGPMPKLLIYVSGVTLGISMLLTLLIVASGIYVGESRVTPKSIEAIVPMLGT